MPKTQLVVFDFDWSMVDQDSDGWLFEVLAPEIRRKLTGRQREPGQTIQWTDLIADCLQELSETRPEIRREDIEGALRQIPFHPAMKRGIQLLKDPASLDTTIFILSNANTFFIHTIVEQQGIRECFDAIVSNPAAFSDTSNPHRLVLHRRMGPNDPPHKCEVGCEEYMCKGQELDRYIDTHRQATHTDYDRVVYVGDGANDFCAVLRLRSQDMVLCRRYHGLECKIAQERGRGEGSRLKCMIEYWSGAWEVEEKFKVYAQASSLGALD